MNSTLDPHPNPSFHGEGKGEGAAQKFEHSLSSAIRSWLDKLTMNGLIQRSLVLVKSA